MSNNIYIGNRYVPVFANPVEWDNLREYEPLTIVTYQGTAYTSRQTVPVGTALSNTDYWVVTGNYNAQVEQYRQDVVNLSNSVDTRFAGVNNNIDDIESDINIINYGTIVCIGDSYLAGWTPTGDVTPWGTYVASFLGKTVGTDLFNYSQGGCGFGSTHEGNNFGTLLTQASNDNRFSNDDVGAVIVLGGANEPASANVTTAINSFVANAHTYFPNAKVFYGYGSTFIATSAYTVCYINERYQMANTNACFMGNLAKYLTAYNELYYHADERHPNDDGQKYLAKLVVQCLMGSGVGDVSRESKTVSGSIIEYISGNTWTQMLYRNISKIKQLTGHTSDGNTLLDTIEKDGSYQCKTDDNFYVTSTTGLLYSSGKFRPCNFKLVNTPTSIKIYDTCLNDTGGNYQTGDTLRYELSPYKYELPVEIV